MQHFPIFVALSGRVVVVSGGAAAAVAKLRLLLKTEAVIGRQFTDKCIANFIKGELDAVDAAMAKIEIYSTARCPYCIAAKNLLDARGLEFREMRIDTDVRPRRSMAA